MTQGETLQVHSEGASCLSQMDVSYYGGVGNASTVESDSSSTASSVDRGYCGVPIPDPDPDPSASDSSTVTTASLVSIVGSVSPPVAQMTPAAHNANRGALYSSDLRARDQTSSTLGRATDLQIAEGLVEDTATHIVEQEPPFGRDRDLDISGQSYIQ